MVLFSFTKKLNHELLNFIAERQVTETAFLQAGSLHVRNQDGSVAHGKDDFLDTLTTQHARVFVLKADMIVSLLMMAYDGTEPSIRHTPDPHARFRHLNDRIDRGMAMEAEIDDETGTLIVTVYRPQEQ